MPLKKYNEEIRIIGNYGNIYWSVSDNDGDERCYLELHDKDAYFGQGKDKMTAVHELLDQIRYELLDIVCWLEEEMNR